MEDSVNKLEAMFNKAETDIDYISRKLDAECANLTEGTGQVNPAEVIKRLDTIKTEYGAIVQEAQAIQDAQKDAMVFFRDQLTNLCTTLSSLQGATGLPKGDKPPELEHFEALLGVNTSTSSTTTVDSELGASSGTENTYTIKYPAVDTAAREEKNKTVKSIKSSGKSSGAKCPGTVEPELSAYDKRSQSCECIDISEAEFTSVSSLVRGRAKLAEVNHTYRILWSHFKDEGNSDPLTSAEMYKMGLRVTGQTGEAKLKVLRALKLLNISKKGDVTLL